MDTSQPTPTPQESAPIAAPSTPPPPPSPSDSGTHAKPRLMTPLLLSVVFLVTGLVGGYAFSTLSGAPSASKTSEITVSDSGSIKLPSEAISIQSCSNKRGTLYVKPSDIPVGPVYMVYEGKVIGVEYMLSKDEFLTGKSYENLIGSGVKVDHVNIGLLSQGHEGYTSPHYHVDVYSVPREVADGIKCPSTGTPTLSPTATESATPSASASATKSASVSASPSASLRRSR